MPGGTNGRRARTPRPTPRSGCWSPTTSSRYAPSRSACCEQLGHHDVTEAADGQETVDALAAAPHDLLLLDLSMPRLSGLDVVRWVNDRPEIGAALTIVVISASALDERPALAELGVDAGAAQAVPPPADHRGHRPPAAALTQVRRAAQAAPRSSSISGNWRCRARRCGATAGCRYFPARAPSPPATRASAHSARFRAVRTAVTRAPCAIVARASARTAPGQPVDVGLEQRLEALARREQVVAEVAAHRAGAERAPVERDDVGVRRGPAGCRAPGRRAGAPAAARRGSPAGSRRRVHRCSATSATGRPRERAPAAVPLDAQHPVAQLVTGQPRARARRSPRTGPGRGRRTARVLRASARTPAPA